MKWLFSLSLLLMPAAVLAQSPAPGCPNFSAQKVINAARIPVSRITVLSAHRGYWQFVPENSTMAVTAAVNACIEMSEIDVRLTKDGVPVLQHDVALDRTTTGSGYVSNICYYQGSSLCSRYATPYELLLYKNRLAQQYTDPSTGQPVSVQSLANFLPIMATYPNLVLVIDAKDQGPSPVPSPTSYATLIASWNVVKAYEGSSGTTVRNRIIWKMRVNELPTNPNQINSDLGFCSGTKGDSALKANPEAAIPPGGGACPISPGQGSNALSAATTLFNLVPIWYANDPQPATGITLCGYATYLNGTQSTVNCNTNPIQTSRSSYLWSPEISINTPAASLNDTLAAYQGLSQPQNVTSFVPASDWAEGMSQATGTCCRFRYEMPFTITGDPTSLPTPPNGQGPVQYTGDVDFSYTYGHYNWISGDHVLDLQSYLSVVGQRNTALIAY